jgi:serine protease AprX
MNLKHYWITKALIAFTLWGQAQTPGWVFFTDKGATSIENYNEAEVYTPYLDSLKKMGLEVSGKSRWFNAAYVRSLNDEKLSQVTFVNSWRTAGTYQRHFSSTQNNKLSYGFSQHQLQMLGLDSLHRKGYTGGNIILALFDGGFVGVDQLDAFKQMREGGQIYSAEDFVEADSVYTSSGHGTAVLSIAGGFYPDSLIGAAPGARFVLVRTEDVDSETHQEELNWVNAMEWADALGVDIIHSSLGYSEFDSLEGDYSYRDMDGQSTIISLAADIAAGRGIFVTNSAGNTGEKEWRFITAPCDGLNVLCIGAVDSFGKHAAFSGYGPSADGRIKPELVAMGKDNHYISRTGYIGQGSGTSFSGPLVAGLVACLKQAYPGTSNTLIREALIQSAHLYHQPNDSMGYGIPNGPLADSLLQTGTLNSSLYDLSSLKVAPNPVKNSFQLLNNSQNIAFALYRLDGVKMQEGIIQGEEAVTLDAHVRNGTYVLRIQNSNRYQSSLLNVLR